jgi:hypothetical protein
MRAVLEAKRTLSLEWRREDHAGGGAAVGQKLFDEVFEFGHRCEDDLQQEGVVAGEVMALLYRVKRWKELEERFVARALAGKAHKGCDGEAESLKIDVCAIAADEFKALEAAKALGGCGGREADATAELCHGEARVHREFSKDFAVDLVDSCV